jgi:hypothetical protein
MFDDSNHLIEDIGLRKKQYMYLSAVDYNLLKERFGFYSMNKL